MNNKELEKIKKVFKKNLEKIRNSHKSNEEISSVYSKQGIIMEAESFTDPLFFEDNVIELLSMLISKNGEEGEVAGWITWFVYDNEFGNLNLEARDENNEIIPMNNTDDLWAFLTRELETEE